MTNGDQSLTGREAAIRELLVLGRSNKEIAAELGVSLSCAKFHVGNVFRKLQVHSRIELLLKENSLRSR